jgi:hypothetical protein
MAESHIVSGLTTKHAELIGIIQFHQEAITRIAADLKHLDATLKLFAPEIDLRRLGSRRVRKASVGGGFKRFKSKESHTLVLDRLRVATEPLTTAMICTAIMDDKGIKDNKEVRTSIQRTLTGTLRRLGQRGMIKEVGWQGLTILWQIA